MVPPARPYLLIAAFRELRVLALLGGRRRRRLCGRDAGGRLGTGAWSGVGAGCEVCHGWPGRMSPGLVMAGTGGRAGPEGCWLAWTTTALSRSGICGGATAARVA